MILAQSFQYKGIPVAINIDPIMEVGIISFKDKLKSIKTKNIKKLKLIAESLIDQENNGNIHNIMY